MQDIETKLKETVKNLLASGKADLVIGYEKGSLPLRSRPCFVRTPAAAEKLVWNAFCANNLAVYLPRLFEKPPRAKEDYAPPKVGIVAKGCDARSIVGLLKEHQVPRENVVIIAVPCPGMVDPARVEAAMDGAWVVDCVSGPDGSLKVTARSGQTKQLAGQDALAEACLECAHPSAEGTDVVVEGEARRVSDRRYEKVVEFEAKSPQQRWQYFLEQISRCIRCNACRQACPNCYCKVCFADQTKPRWIGPGDDLSDVMLYHIGRIFHQAGRCVECDACVRGCPMHIDLRVFTQKLAKDVEDLFDYVAGLSADELPPLRTFKDSDSEHFITEP
jgi:formate dehydrogenase subunit beta